MLELGAGELHHQVLRHAVGHGDVGQVDFGLHRAGELNLGLLGSLFQALHGHGVLAEVDALVALEAVGHPVDNLAVEVVAAEVRVAVGALHLEDAVAKVQNRDIERAATEVEHCHVHILGLLVEAVGQCGSGRLVDDTAHLQACNLAGLLGGLTLAVVEVGRDGDDGLRHLGAEVVFGGLLHLLQHDGTDFLRGILAAVDVDAGGVVVAAHHLVGHSLNLLGHLVVGLAHEALDAVDGVVGVGDGLTLGGVAHLAVAILEESYHRGGGAVALAVSDNYWFVTFHDADTTVGCAEVDSDDFCHFIFPFLFYFLFIFFGVFRILWAF